MLQLWISCKISLFSVAARVHFIVCFVDFFVLGGGPPPTSTPRDITVLVYYTMKPAVPQDHCGRHRIQTGTSVPEVCCATDETRYG